MQKVREEDDAKSIHDLLTDKLHNAHANVTEYRVQGGAISPAIFWRFSLC